MLLAKLQEWLMRALYALWTMAVLNPRMSAAGIVGALALVFSHTGLQLTPDQQTKLAASIVLFIGLVSGDQINRRKIR